MKKLILIISFLLCISVPDSYAVQKNTLSNEKLLNLAYEKAHSTMKFPKTTKPLVEDKGKYLIITYPTNLKPGVKGPDYHVKLHIKKADGKIFKILVGS